MVYQSICSYVYLLGVSVCGFPAWVRVDSVKLEVGTMQSTPPPPPPGINRCEYSIIMTANVEATMEQLLTPAAAPEDPYLATSLQPLPPLLTPPLSPLSRIQQHTPSPPPPSPTPSHPPLPSPAPPGPPLTRGKRCNLIIGVI